jgi:ketosteroid isomerase-like protein
MKRMLAVLSLVGAVLMASAIPAGTTSTTQGAQNMEDGKAQIQALTREFVAGFNSGDINRMMKFYADRYVDVNLRRPVQSKAERTAYYQKILDRKDTKVEVYPDEIIVMGTHAFARGTLLVFRTPKGGGEVQRKELRYIEIWEKHADGWKSIWGMDAELYPDEK